MVLFFPSSSIRNYSGDLSSTELAKKNRPEMYAASKYVLVCLSGGVYDVFLATTVHHGVCRGVGERRVQPPAKTLSPHCLRCLQSISNLHLANIDDHGRRGCGVRRLRRHLPPRLRPRHRRRRGIPRLRRGLLRLRGSLLLLLLLRQVKNIATYW